jgi:hypothetical protein
LDADIIRCCHRLLYERSRRHPSRLLSFFVVDHLISGGFDWCLFAGRTDFILSDKIQLNPNGQLVLLSQSYLCFEPIRAGDWYGKKDLKGTLQFWRFGTGCEIHLTTAFKMSGSDSILSYAMIRVGGIYAKMVFVRNRGKKIGWCCYEQQIRTDKRTFGQLFYCVYKEMADIAFLESLQRILTMAIDKLRKA